MGEQINIENKVFGERVKELRIEYGLSQDSLCEALNDKYGIELNKSLISRYENGKHLPKFPVVQSLADLFKVTTDFLMGLSNSRYSQSVIEIDLKRIPLVGVVRAGEPLLMVEDYDEYEYTDNKKADFALRVVGESMIGARIYPGDIALIMQQSDVDNGEIAVVAIDGEEATIKRVYKDKGKITLHAENPAFPDKVFTKRELGRLRIIGKVIEIKFKIA